MSGAPLTRYGPRTGIIGRPPCDDRAVYYAQRFGISGNVARHWKWRLLDQLDLCKCDEARRLILGVSK